MNMHLIKALSPILLAAFLALAPVSSIAAGSMDSPVKDFIGYGDLRLRLESDYDGENSSGTEVDDRTRARIRVRTGVKYHPNDWLTFDARIRTGSNESHQSPHITVYDFNHNPRGDADINIDKWYVNIHDEKSWFWLGRNSFPFWSQHEIFWDEDATLPGLAGGTSYNFDSKNKLSLNAGYFALPVGMRDFSGTLTAGEIIYDKKYQNANYSLGIGLFHFQPDPGDNDAATLLNDNGLRKYTIATINAKREWEYAGLPITMEIDVLYNMQNYSASSTNAFTAQNYDQKNGYVLSVKAGDMEHLGNWLAAYYYAYIENFAVNSSYAPDDWVRWGAGGETRSSNMKGHQFNLGYAVTDDINVLARLYLVEAITNDEQGNRFRIDVNYTF